MNMATVHDPAGDFHIKRINNLFANTPSSMVSIAIGIVLVALILSIGSSASLLKLWVTYMLSALALRGGMWFMHRSASNNPQSARWWEFGYAMTMFFTGIGWGSLSGPLYPDSPSGQVFILVLTMVVGFSGAIYSSVSRLSFFMFAMPCVLPSMLRFVWTLDPAAQLTGALASAGGILVLINVHETLHRLAIRHLRHEVEVETLLMEQEMIFQSVSAGIAVVRDGKTIKCNTRLGEILGRSLKDVQVMPLSAMFTSAEDVQTILAATANTLKGGEPIHALYRMRRADGSEFVAELSGRRMGNERGGDMIWLISDVGRRDRRADD